MLRQLRALLVQPVPESVSVCEFDCPVVECTMKTWSRCRLRTPAPRNDATVACYSTPPRLQQAPLQLPRGLDLNSIKYNL